MKLSMRVYLNRKLILSQNAYLGLILKGRFPCFLFHVCIYLNCGACKSLSSNSCGVALQNLMCGLQEAFRVKKERLVKMYNNNSNYLLLNSI